MERTDADLTDPVATASTPSKHPKGCFFVARVSIHGLTTDVARVDACRRHSIETPEENVP
jgi:hypothetical protein